MVSGRSGVDIVCPWLSICESASLGPGGGLGSAPLQSLDSPLTPLTPSLGAERWGRAEGLADCVAGLITPGCVGEPVFLLAA